MDESAGFSKVFKVLWEMKKDGYAESTIKSTGKKLRMMVRDGVNLDDSDEVKEYIAAKGGTNGYKEVLCDVYDRYVKYHGLKMSQDHISPHGLYFQV